MSDYDVIVIGSGAGGGTLVRHLAPSGKRILLLERGDWLPREPQNWLAQDVFVDGPLRLARHLVLRGSARRSSRRCTTTSAAPPSSTAPRSTGCEPRTSASSTTTTASRRRGRSPTTRWSRTTRKAEQLYQVHGARGEDPTEPPASGPYPFPAVSHEPRIQQLSDDLEKAGLHPFHAPCGILLDESNMPYSKCVRCDNCDGFPCVVHAKSDAEVISVRPGARALERDAAHRRRGGPARDQPTRARRSRASWSTSTASTETFKADVVVVSCGAANSAKLLLASANDAHPHGLANGSDQVGRNYMFHNSQAVLALSKEENPTVFQKTLGVNDFYFSGGEDFDYPLGNIQMVGKSQAPMFRGEKPGETRFAPDVDARGGRPPRGRLLALDRGPAAAREPRHARARRQHRDRLQGRATSEAKDRLFDKLKDMLGDLGMHHGHLLPHHAYLKNEIPVAGCAHQAGTCRFGTDPDSSVLNTDCRAHERRQPVRRRHELLPEHRRGQPGAHRDGERDPRRRPPARTTRALPATTGARPCLMISYKHRVVIVGGGFAGLGCALTARRPRRRPRHADRPQQLPPVPAAALPGGDLAAGRHRHRALAARGVRRPGQRRRQARRDHRRRHGNSNRDDRATASRGPATRSCWPPARSRTSSAPRARPENSFPLYSLDDATRLRSRILGLFEQVDRDPTLVERGALNIVIVGGGPTGVEVAGALGDMIKVTVPGEYRNLDADAGPDPPARLRRRAAKAVLGQGPRLRRQGPRRARESRSTSAPGSRRSRPVTHVLSDGTRHPHALRRLGRRDQGRRGGRRLRPRPGARRTRRRRARPDPRRQPRRVLHRRHRQHPRRRRRIRSRSSAPSPYRAARGRRTTSSPTFDGKERKDVRLPRQGDHGDDRPRRRDRRGRQAPPRDPRRARAHGLARRPRQPA